MGESKNTDTTLSVAKAQNYRKYIWLCYMTKQVMGKKHKDKFLRQQKDKINEWEWANKLAKEENNWCMKVPKRGKKIL